MKLFKQALLASAILGAFGAQAADLTDAVTKTSKQGLEIAAAADNTSIRVIVREQLEAGDRITLTFGKGVTGLTAVATNAAGEAQATSTNNELGIVYGSGTYKIKPISTTTTSGVTTVVLEVMTGDPVTKDSSFEVQVRGANIDKSKASEATVTYSAKSGLTGNAKDTTGDNTGNFIVLADQYGASVSTKANGVIQRNPATLFISGAVDTTNTDADTIAVKITDTQSLLSKAAGVNVQATVTIEGDFSSTTIAGAVAAVAGTTISAPAIATDKKSISFTVTDTAGATGIEGTYTLTLDNNATAASPIKASEFKATVVVDADTTSATNTKLEALVKADAGEWVLDATIINIPYFPVGFEGVNTSVHFANETSSEVDVIITANDDKGVSYSTTNQSKFLAKNSVTKVSQVQVMDLLKDSKGNKVPAGSKLSITFNFDVDKGKVNAYAFSEKAGAGRQSLVTSQQKGSDK
ncbi:hypothetical protein NI389_07445 [Pseudoalteromonas xiamenensis]|uniref:hypothetical protein n=1 Tax=Pseudoalteromonas xiamenensis TaxID=882626 RepID=UPI0027E4052C|nr:hypothetical protein [Pseudoalteromonas xiamenensis]WMN61207.1 hypothetical protein NI389_07445 [Pseudoalteromonas xiamenensis]